MKWHGMAMGFYATELAFLWMRPKQVEMPSNQLGKTMPCLPSPSHHHRFIGGIVVYIYINHSQSWLVNWHCFSHINCRWNMNHGWNQAASLYFAPAMGQIRKWWYGTTKKPSGYKPPRLQEDFSDGDGSANTHRGSGIPTRPNKQDRNCFQITLW